MIKIVAYNQGLNRERFLAIRILLIIANTIYVSTQSNLYFKEVECNVFFINKPFLCHNTDLNYACSMTVLNNH